MRRKEGRVKRGGQKRKKGKIQRRGEESREQGRGKASQTERTEIANTKRPSAVLERARALNFTGGFAAQFCHVLSENLRGGTRVDPVISSVKWKDGNRSI